MAALWWRRQRQSGNKSACSAFVCRIAIDHQGRVKNVTAFYAVLSVNARNSALEHCSIITAERRFVSEISP
jgi:hypothetical protein